MIEHQINFVCFLMGRPVKLMPDQLLKNAHSGRRIPESTFNEVATILQSVLDKNGMEKTDIDSIIQIVASHKNSIVELPTFTRTHNQ